MTSNNVRAMGFRSTIALFLALLSLFIAGVSLLRPRGAAPVAGSTASGGSSVAGATFGVTSVLLDRIEKTGELRAGYGVYPPYTQEDPTTQKVSGFSVELIE